MDDDMLFNLIKTNENQQLNTIVDCNSYTKTFGVSLSNEEAHYLLECRKSTLRTTERMEFEEGILPKLIYTFCDSPFIYQDNYKGTLEALQEIFYLYKNESLDELSDDELLHHMKKLYNGICQGSLEYLEDTCLENFCRNIRSGKPLMED